jgi:outer membrane protein assembly factor BamB
MKSLGTLAICIVLASLFMTAPPALTANSSGVTLSPGTGHSGAEVIVKGARFGCSETVRVSFDGAIIGKAATDDSGNFSLRFTVPESLAAKGYPVVATGTKSGLSADSVFTVNDPPSIVLSPASDPIGGLVTVAGASFGSSESVVISLGATQVANAATNGAGGFTQDFLVPAGTLPGHYTVTATGQTSRLTAIAKFTVTTPAPAITLNLAYGPPTTQIKVTGSGFSMDEAVDIFFDISDLALAATNAEGAFAREIEVPADAAAGEHWITAVGRSSRLSVQAAFAVQTDWPQFHYGLRHSGYNPFENALNVTSVVGLGQAWTASTGGVVNSSPALVNGVVYVGSFDGNLYAFKASTGVQIWKAATGSAIFSSPAVAGGVVYVGSQNGNLYAFKASTGAQIWKAAAGSAIFSSPAVANGVVYVGSQKGNLYAFNASTGAQIWKAATGSAIFSSPAVANEVVYVGSENGKLYAFKASTGAQYWKAATGSAIFSSPAIADGVVYVGSDDHSLYAFKAGTGAQIWKAATKAEIESSPAVANEVVYVGSEDGNLYAFKASTGAQIWKVAAGIVVNSSPAVANGVVYAGSNSGNIYAFNASTGAQIWMAATGAAIESSPAVANGVVYAGSADNNLYTFNLAAGMSGSSAAAAGSSTTGETAIGPPDPAGLIPDYSLELK